MQYNSVIETGVPGMGKWRGSGLAAFGVALTATLTLPAWAEPRPHVVELFTSQACSSCPPADALLAELAHRPGVVALGFHITYWDGPGWKDKFSSRAATARQEAYARRFNAGQVYTPEIVVDGAHDMVGSDRSAVLTALAEPAPQALAPVAFAADRRSVEIGPASGAGGHGGDVLLVRFQQQRTTPVAGGENAGRTLRDANGVLGLSRLGSWSGAPAHFAIQPPAAGEGIAVLVQAPDGAILGAAALTAAAGS
jgi:hypothetical protein